MIPPKEYSKPPVHGPKEMETQGLSNKKFQNTCSKNAQKLQKNTYEHYNIRKTINKQNENFNRDRKH